MMRVALCVLLFSLSLFAEDYCFGFLMSVPNRAPLPEAQANEIQKGHLAHMEKMALAGKLLAAGPMAGDTALRGIVIYKCQSLEDAAGFTEPDPAVQNKRLQPVFQMWRGPNDVGEPLSSEVQADPKAKYTMVTVPFVLLRRTAKWEKDPPLKLLRKELDFLNKLRRRKQLRMDGSFFGQPNLPYDGPEPGALLVFAAMPLKDAIGIAKSHPLVEAGYATVEAHEWYVADEAIPLP